jgi:pimeloyl-ACP methyl ester carboxylesterase
LRDKLKRIDRFGLYIHGQADPLIPVEGAIETQKLAPKSRLVIMPGMGHMFFNRKLEDLILEVLIEHFGAAIR